MQIAELKRDITKWEKNIGEFEVSLVVAMAEVQDLTEQRKGLLLPAREGDATAKSRLQKLTKELEGSKLRQIDAEDTLTAGKAKLVDLRKALKAAEHHALLRDI